MQTVKRLSLWIFYGLLGYMPLHIFLSTWLGTSFGVLEFAKICKDIILIIGFAGALAASLRQAWFKQLLLDRLIWLIVAYGLLTLALAILKPTDQDAEILGVVYNLRFLIFFLYAWLLSRLYNPAELNRRALRIVLMVATVVLFFGVVQYTFLPNDALSHVGYERSNGVLPAFFIDDKPDLERAMSTLRDPNSLGSYVIIIGCLGLALWASKRAPLKLTLGLIGLSILCLLFTFSRSGWIGFAIATLVFVGLYFRGQIFRLWSRKIILAGVLVVVISVGAIYSFRNTYFVKNVIFHADESTVLEDPNQLRTRFIKESVREISHQPLGHGPGTAGLASIRNEKQGTVLNENYYLQLAHEVGVLGLGLFLAILGIIGWRLWQQAKADVWALGLLAALVGLLITNLFVHIWSNEAVAYTWWGLAGLIASRRYRQ